MIVLQKFFCKGAGNDCPRIGYEVVESQSEKVKKGEVFLDIDVEQLKKELEVRVFNGKK